MNTSSNNKNNAVAYSFTGRRYAGANNELAVFAQNKLRKIYNAKNLDVYSLDDIDRARVELLKYKTPLMREWDGMVHDLARYLNDRLLFRDGYIAGSHDETKDIREILRVGYKTILNHNDTEDFEYKFLAFCKGLHEWLWRFRFSEKAKQNQGNPEEKAKENAWLRFLENMANELVDEINAIDRESQEDSVAKTQDDFAAM